MEKYIYVVTEINYGEYCVDNDTLQLLKVFKNKNEAIKYTEELVENRKMDFILDECCDDEIKVDNVIRFFDRYQDDWNAYFEICVKKVILD